MAILVLQTFAVQCCSTGRTTHKKPARLQVTCSPAEVTDSLEAEHGIENIERNQRCFIVAV